MDRKNLLIASGLISGIVVLSVIGVFMYHILVSKNGADDSVPIVYFDNSTPEATTISTAIVNFKTFIMGITPVATYNYVSYNVNWHLFKKDNSYEKGKYSQSNYYIKNWANDIKNDKKYPQLNTNEQKGNAIFD